MKPKSLRPFGLVVAGAFVLSPALSALNITWDGGGSDGLLQTATNWDGDALPSVNGDTMVWNGLAAGALSLNYGGGLEGAPGNTGLNINLTGSQTDSVTIDGSAAALRLNGITLDAGSGAFTLGSGSGTAAITLGGAVSQIHTWTNNSANTATVNSDVALGLGGGGAHALHFSGSGNWNVSAAITPTNAAQLSIHKTGTGELNLSGGGSLAAGVTAYGGSFAAVFKAGTTRISSGTYVANAGEVVVGGLDAAGTNTQLIMDGGSLSGVSWLSVGRGNGTSTTSSDIILNNASSLSTGNVSGGFNAGNGATLPKGSITLNNTSSITITGNGALNLAESAGSNITVTLNNTSQFTAAGTAIKYIGQAGTGVVNINGTSTLSLGNALTYIGYQAGNGTVNLNGGTFNNTGEVRVGGSITNGTGPNGTGTLNITSGTANFGGLVVARGNNNQNTVSGSVTVSGGTLNSVNDVVLGYAGNNNLGKLTVSGGTVNVGTTAAKWLQVGVWDTSKGQVDISSGFLNLLNGTQIKMNAQGTTGANVINQSGGAVTFYSDSGTTVGGTGHLDMQRAGAAGSNNTYNLNGGTLTVPQILSTTTTGTRTFNFNGGTLKATGSTTAFMNLGAGSARANVRNNGAVIDSNGYNVTISQPLLHSNIGGDNATDGGLTKQGVGNLTLSGANTYNGTTNVNAGTLTLTGSLTSSITVANGATLAGTGSTTGSLTMTSGSIFAANTAGAAFTANGVNFSGPTTLIYNGSTTNGSTYDLFFYGAGGVSNLGNLSSTFRTTLFDDTINKKVTGTVQVGNLTWNTTNGTWSLGGANWTGAFANYYDGDSVTFGNSGATSTITLSGSLIPNSIAVNSTDNYIFSGSGSIAGTSSLVKSGTGSLTIDTANSFSGGTTLTDGTIILGTNTALGSGAVALNGGTLDMNGRNIANAVAMGGGAVTGAGTIAGVVSGTTLTKNSAGTLALSNVANTVDNINITAGTLSINNGGALGDVMNTLDGGTLETTNVTALTISRPLTIGSGGGTMNIVGAAVTGQGSRVIVNTANALLGSGNLTISGNGALATDGGQGVFVVTSSNTFNGNVNLVNGGLFEYDNASAVASTATFTLGNNSEISATNGRNVVNAITVNGTGGVLSFNNNGAGIFSGPITLNADVNVAMRNWWNYSIAQNGTISGVISGNGGLSTSRGTSTGAPILSLTGVNTYAGNTTINANTTLKIDGAGQLGSGNYAGNITNNGTLNQNSSASQTYSGTISGSGSIVQSGAGNTTLSGTHSFTGATNVSAGSLIVNGNISTSVLTTVSGTGTLSGTGSVGDLTATTGGTVSPGNSPGILYAGDTNLGSGSTLAIEINGDTVGSGYDQLNVTGTVSLSGLLSISLGYTPVENTLFFILANDDTDAVTGTFAGLANESWFNVGSQLFRISYFGDSGSSSFTGGNDVVLMAVPEPRAALLGGLGLLALLRRRRSK